MVGYGALSIPFISAEYQKVRQRQGKVKAKVGFAGYSVKEDNRRGLREAYRDSVHSASM